ncbi:alanyl-tRNA synthetase [Leuconostoc citreum]
MPDLKEKELVEKVVDEKPVKSRLGILVLMIVGILVVIFGSLIIYAMTTTHKTSQSSTGISSPKVTKNVTTSKYVAGKDYKVTYSNQNVIDKSVLDKALGENGLNDVPDLMDSNKDTGANMAKVEVYYNKDKNLLVERLFENGYKNDEEKTVAVYDLTKKEVVDLGISNDINYKGLPLVYKWEKLAK